MIPPPSSTDVAVVGGGPAGLAAAIALRRRGFGVLLADCAVPPIDKACGEGIMPDGLAAARSLGLDLEHAGQPFRGIRFHDEGNSVAAEFPNGPGMGMRRTVLHQLLVDRAAAEGVRMAWGVRTTGMDPHSVCIDGRSVHARWIVGADGSNSMVRRWAGLDASTRNSRRFGFRRHYAVAPWSSHMEIHWGDGCQIYVTPVDAQEVCVVLISRDPKLRMDEALPRFPALQRRLPAPAPDALERGGVTATRQLRAVCNGRVALVGEASGSVDAITGEGLCLLFQHAVAVADAMAAGDLSQYQTAHRRIGGRPRLMADLMLLLENRRLRHRAIRTMSAYPHLFARMLEMHVGELSNFEFLRTGVAFGMHLMTI